MKVLVTISKENGEVMNTFWVEPVKEGSFSSEVKFANAIEDLIDDHYNVEDD